MHGLALFAFALAAGLTVCGCVATLVEIAAGRPISFSPPFTSRERVLPSLALTLAAGPMMLLSDALAARRDRSIGLAMMAACAATALLWSLALGVVVLECARLAATMAERLA